MVKEFDLKKILSRYITTDSVIGKTFTSMKIEDKYQATTLKYYNFITLMLPCNKALKENWNENMTIL